MQGFNGINIKRIIIESFYKSQNLAFFARTRDMLKNSTPSLRETLGASLRETLGVTKSIGMRATW